MQGGKLEPASRRWLTKVRIVAGLNRAQAGNMKRILLWLIVAAAVLLVWTATVSA